jgi:hypothetical protein
MLGNSKRLDSGEKKLKITYIKIKNMRTQLIAQYSLLYFIFLSTINFTSAQCHYDFLNLGNQSEVDQFLLDNPACTTLSGTILIEGNDITNLAAFQNIDSIMGTLAILNCHDLPNLSDLGNLKYIQTLNITGFTLYSNFEGLNNLKQISGTLDLNYINTLVSFEGLLNLDYINRVQIMKSNLSSIGDLNSIDSISSVSVSCSANLESVVLINLTNNYGLNFYDNRNLKSVTIENPFQNATSLSFFYNPLLSNLSGFENLKVIDTDRGGLFLGFNPLLSSTNAFNNVRLLSNLRIVNSEFDSLQFNALENISDSLVIVNNALLSFCSVDAVCDKVLNDSLIRINNNLAECSTNQDVINACKLISADNTYLDKTLYLFPNPTDGVLNFKRNEINSNATANILNLNGKVMRSFKLLESSQINIKGLSPGIYFIEILEKQNRFIQKFIYN